MILNIAILLTVVAFGAVLWSPKLMRFSTWRATATPLASIIGSGFLILGPILVHAYGVYAPLAMAGLCLTAFLFGNAIRYNIHAREQNSGHTPGLGAKIEILASASLAFAYIISVAYYLNLFGAFAVSLTPFDGSTNAKLATSAMLLFILAVGWSGGFKWLERMEYVSVALKLAIIAGLLAGLAIYFTGKVGDGGLIFSTPAKTGQAALFLAFGLIVTVQGFETSRYLRDEYDARTRAKSMLWAQWTATAIYMSYILLMAYVFDSGEVKLTETAIIDMMAVVAPILPFLLVAAALAAQFSAAVADTSGSGGLLAELSNGYLSARLGYAVLVAVGLLLTWYLNVFQIINYASRAFAAYYALQSLIAALCAWQAGARPRSAFYALLALLGAAMVLLGQSAEASATG